MYTYFIFLLLTLDQHGLEMEYIDTDTRLPGFKSQHCLFQAVRHLLWFLHLLVSYPLSPGFVANKNSDTFWIQQWSHESLHCPLKKPEFKVLETTAKQPGRSVRTNRMQATQQQSVGAPGSQCPPRQSVSPGHIPKWRYSGYQVWFVLALPHTVGIIFSEEKEQFGKARRSLKSKSQKHLEITWFKNTKKQIKRGQVFFLFLAKPAVFFLLSYVFLHYFELKFDPNWL